MSTTTQERLGEARASLVAAEMAVASERAGALDEQLDDAVAEIHRIGNQIAEHEKRLVTERMHAEALWAKRALVDKALRDLDAELPQFPIRHELESYERKRTGLVNEYESLTAEIREGAIPIAQGQDAIDKLKAMRYRAELGVNDLRIAVRAARTGTRQHM
jgi:chromosome segregation ATPase